MLLIVGLIHILHPLLKLLPDLLALQPGYVPDLHPPGAPQGTGLGLDLLEAFWTELEELVLVSLEEGDVLARGNSKSRECWVNIGLIMRGRS